MGHKRIFIVCVIVYLMAACFSSGMFSRGSGLLPLACREEIILCAISTEEKEGNYVFALSPPKGQLLWKVKCNTPVSYAWVDDQKHFYLIEQIPGKEKLYEKEYLVCRSIQDGKVLWETEISSIKPADNALSKRASEEILEEIKEPFVYVYKGPFQNGDAVVVFRHANGPGDFGSSLFYDWLSFSRVDGKLITKDEGLFLGCTDTVLLCEIGSQTDDDEADQKPQIQLLKNGRIKKTLEESSFPPDELSFNFEEYFESYDVSITTGTLGLVTNEFEDDTVYIYDEKTGRLSCITAQAEPDYHWKWILLPEYACRFSEAVRDKKDRPFCVELYDFKGKLIGKNTFPQPFGKEYFVDFAGTNQRGDILLFDKGILYTIGIKGLESLGKVEIECSSPDQSAIGGSVYPVRGRDKVCIVISEGQTGSVSLVDYQTGKNCWAYSEKLDP